MLHIYNTLLNTSNSTFAGAHIQKPFKSLNGVFTSKADQTYMMGKFPWPDLQLAVEKGHGSCIDRKSLSLNTFSSAHRHTHHTPLTIRLSV